MGARRVLLIRAQRLGAVPPTVGASIGDITFVSANDREFSALMRDQPPFAAVVIDAFADHADADAGIALLRRVGSSGYPAPLIALVPPGAGGLARAALVAGVQSCIPRIAGYGEQLSWQLDAIIAHQELAHDHRRLQEDFAEVVRQRQLLGERLSSTLHHLSEGVLLLDARTRTLLSANAAAERLFGTPFTAGEPLDEHPIYHLRDRAGRLLRPEETPIRRVLATEQARIGERLVIERPDGLQIAVAASTVPLYDAAGELQCLVSVYQELTDQAHAQLVRDEVLSIASHELRTPLTVILGYSSLLRTLPTIQNEPRLQRASTKIYEQSLRMRDLIEQLLDFSRITLGRLQLQWIEFDLNTLVREVGTQQQAEARPHQLRLALPNTPLAITGDYGRLAQALQQVIRAAWQSAPEEVVIALHTGSSESFRTIGMTLPPDTERRYALISIGRRAQPSPETTPATVIGSHLGGIEGIVAPDKALELTISAELVRLHGGALLIERQPTQGDAFSLLLPLQDGPTTP